MEKIPFLEPFDLNGLPLKNRIVMAPMGRSRADNTLHTVSELQQTYYTQRAGAGLVITEGVLVSEEANGGLGLPGIYNEQQIDSWRKITDGVHQKGGKIFIQLWHTGRLSHPKFLKGNLPKGPSVLPFQAAVYTEAGFENVPVGEEFTLQEIAQVIHAFKNAGSNAMIAGFDGVEIQGGNGYLVHQFLNYYSNQRNDQYGGSIENRSRFLLEIIENLAQVMPVQRIGVRLNPSQHNILGMDLDSETIPTHEHVVKSLNNFDLAYLHLVSPYTDVTDHHFGVSDVVQHFRPIYKGNLITNGGYNREKTEQVLRTHDADLVSFGKLFISNPDLVQRLANNWPLNPVQEQTIYGGNEVGYTDYPFYEATSGSPV